MTTKSEQVARQQAEWFGQPLNELFSSVCTLAGFTQAELAKRLGISAPMVSLLVSGQREKPGNPQVQNRILALHRALQAYERGLLDLDQFRHQIDAAAPLDPSQQTGPATASADSMEHVLFLRSLIARIDEPTKLKAAVKLLGRNHPELAEFVRVFGSGQTSEGVEYLRRLESS